MSFRSRVPRRAVVLISTVALFSTLAPNALAESNRIDGKGGAKVVEHILDVDQHWKTQAKLDDLVKDIRANEPSSEAHGISGVVVDPAKNSLSLY